MKVARLAVLFAAAALAAPVFASTATPTSAAAATNLSKSRAEVKAELARARADGLLGNPNAPGYPQQFATGGYTVPVAQIPALGMRHAVSSQGSTLD